jgi:hypothetical protein
MNHRQCPMEETILAATRSEGFTDEVSRHLSTCRSCSDAVTVDRLFQLESRALPELDRLPDPRRIWLRARQQRLAQAAQQATRPIRMVEKLAMGTGAAGLAVGTAMAWPLVRSWLSGTATLLTRLGSGTEGALAGNPWPFIAVALLFLALFGLYSELVEG